MGITSFSSDKKVPFELRWYHAEGEHSEEWAQVVHYDVIEEPDAGKLYLVHPDGTRYSIEATEEGLRVLVSGRHGGGVISRMTSGNVVEIANLHKDYRKRLLNAPIEEKDQLEKVAQYAERLAGIVAKEGE